MADIHKVAISTGGGDCPGLNAVIRGFVRRGIREFDWEIFGIEDGFRAFFEPERSKVRRLDLAAVRGILPRGGTILGTTNRGDPFSYPVYENGQWVTKDMSHVVIEGLEKLGCQCLVVVGGDGTQDIGYRIHEKGFPVVGVPKTIDNDLAATDYTFGFNTCVEIVTEALDRLHTTAESHDRVIFVEVMGRDTGWIALHSGLAGGADIILIPEIPYDPDAIVEKIYERRKKGISFSIVVVAEGAFSKDGKKTTKELDEAEEKARGKALLGGAGEEAARLVADRCDVEARVTVLGHLQRGGSPSAWDRILATRFGVHAAGAVARRNFGMMVALKGEEISLIPTPEAIKSIKRVDPAGKLVHTARALGICMGD